MEVEGERQPGGKALVKCLSELLAVRNEGQIALKIGAGAGVKHHPILPERAMEGPDVGKPKTPRGDPKKPTGETDDPQQARRRGALMGHNGPSGASRASHWCQDAV